MKAKLLSAGIIGLAMLTSNANAQTIKQTQKNQIKRIGQGVKSGELTKAEAKNLANDQKEIRQEIKTYKADGTFTAAEKIDVKKDQNKASREIYRKKHNRRSR